MAWCGGRDMGLCAFTSGASTVMLVSTLGLVAAQLFKSFRTGKVTHLADL